LEISGKPNSKEKPRDSNLFILKNLFPEIRGPALA
jgi:hypothetical protein